MSPSLDIDALSPTELKSLVLKAFVGGGGESADHRALGDELARLKRPPGRPDIKPSVKPDIKPSGMEKGTERNRRSRR
jgi:hypothetical protein